jgi:preprotein translocase subunit SecA
MITGFLKKIFGSRNDRLIKQYSQTVARINALEAATSDAFRRGLARQNRGIPCNRHAKGETLDDLLPEAFAVVREASSRVLGMRHFDMQLIGGMVLHYGKIAEMRTGEGKTLTATLAVYLNAIPGKGVHLITVNDYLASRDAEWMGRIYRFLGLSVGVNLSQMAHDEKQAAYAADITYGTNNEFGFDYLRDNMVYSADERVQRGLSLRHRRRSGLDPDRRGAHAADHFRPGRGPHRAVCAHECRAAALTRGEAAKEQGDADTGDYTVDLKSHQVLLTEAGHEKAEQILARLGMLAEGSSLYEPANILLIHHLYAALRAHTLYHRDQQYVVQDGEVVIVDEFTGRLMAGRRWSDGLHQAVEAKEGVAIQAENQTLASITFQNYFRMYGKLAGMTGTADTEAYEFHQIYGLETVVIPTNRPMIRKDENDQIYRTAPENTRRSSPTSAPATSAGSRCWWAPPRSRIRSCSPGCCRRRRCPHQVLNAKQHAREAEIVAEAGRPGMITIATNMAGRGTDIVLGGNIEKPTSRDPRRRIPRRRREGRAHRGTQGGMAEGARSGARRRRPAHHRLRTPRIAPHRQPVARPFRSPGRPGFVALLPRAG